MSFLLIILPNWSMYWSFSAFMIVMYCSDHESYFSVICHHQIHWITDKISIHLKCCVVIHCHFVLPAVLYLLIHLSAYFWSVHECSTYLSYIDCLANMVIICIFRIYKCGFQLPDRLIWFMQKKLLHILHLLWP